MQDVISQVLPGVSVTAFECRYSIHWLLIITFLSW